MRIAMAVAITLILAACSEPLVMIPGGALSGDVVVPPADWTPLADIETIQVEVRPSDPYSINIWGVGIGADLYVATSAEGTAWSAMIATDPSVRVRVGTSLYPLTAVRIEDAAEHARVAEAYVAKYEVDPEDNWVSTGLVYRFDRR